MPDKRICQKPNQQCCVNKILRFRMPSCSHSHTCDSENENFTSIHRTFTPMQKSAPLPHLPTKNEKSCKPPQSNDGVVDKLTAVSNIGKQLSLYSFQNEAHEKHTKKKNERTSIANYACLYNNVRKLWKLCRYPHK